MTKNELITTITYDTGVAKTDTSIIIARLITIIKKTIFGEASIYLRRFGTFPLKRENENR